MRIGDCLLAVTLPCAVLAVLFHDGGAGMDRVLAAIVVIASIACFLSIREYGDWGRFGNWKTDTSGTVRAGGTLLTVGCGMALAYVLIPLVDARYTFGIEVPLAFAIVGWSLVLYGRRRPSRKSARAIGESAPGSQG